MKKFRSIMMMGFVLLIVTLSKPVMALNLSSFTDVPNFSVVIGESMYTLNYANNPTNANQISAAIVANKGDIFIKTDDTGWIKNSDGTQVNQDAVDISTIKYNNCQAIGVVVTTNIDKIQVNPTITKTGTNTATFTYNLFDKTGLDITKIIPASDITAIASVSSTIILNPTTGIGTITFTTSSDIDKSISISLVSTNGLIGESVMVTPVVSTVPSIVTQIQVNPTITITGTNTATFTYKILDQSGTDITKTIPASDIIYASASVSSTIVLDPSTGIGTITFNTSADTQVNVTLVDKNGVTGTSSPIKIMLIMINPTITKIGLNTASFKYSLVDQNYTDITKIIPATQISAVASVNSTIVLDPLTSTGTITYNSSTDVDTSIKITITDKVTGLTVSSEMVAPGDEMETPKVGKIVINSTGLGVSGDTGYAEYSIYDQYGNDVTSTSLGSNVTFQTNVGQVRADRGLLIITANAGVDLSTFSSVVITGDDSISGVSTSSTLT